MDEDTKVKIRCELIQQIDQLEGDKAPEQAVEMLTGTNEWKNIANE